VRPNPIVRSDELIENFTRYPLDYTPLYSMKTEINQIEDSEYNGLTEKTDFFCFQDKIPL